jgi:PAS domain S-box-containing protein
MEADGRVIVDRKAALALAALATGVAYYAVADLSLSARNMIPSITPLWPAAGLGLAATLTFDCASACPAVFLASALVARTLGLPALAVGAMAFANALEVFVAGQILNRARLNGYSFYHPRDFALYSLITGASCAAGCLVAVLCFRRAGMLGAVSLEFAFLTRVLAHWAGMLMVTPLLLLWRYHPKLSLRPGPTLEGAAATAATAGVCWLMFSATPAGAAHLPLSFLLPALAVWPAVRLGLRETATINMVIAGSSLWGTVEGRGPFASVPHESAVTLLQGCLCAQAIVGMSLASAVWRAKDATAEMESARKRLRLILDISPGYIAYVDPLLRFSLVNEMFSGWFRAPSQSLVGRSVRELAGEGWAAVRPLLERAFQGETVHDTVIQPDPRGRSHWMDLRVAPDADEAGSIRGVILLAVDVTELKLKEQALRETEARLRLVLDNSPVFIGYVDCSGRYRMINRRFHDWFGRKADAMVGMTTKEALGAAWPQFEPLQRRALSGERVHQALRAPDARGRMRWLDITYVPDADESGGVRGFFISTVDVSALKETEERLRKAEQLLRGLNEELERRVAQRTARLTQVNDELESFAYTVAHDLRSPLRKMSGFSEAVLHDYEARLDPKGAEYLRLIFDSSRRMGRLIDEMLDLSMVTRAEVRDEPVDLSALAAGVVAELRRAEPDRRVEVSVAPGLVARGDPGLLEAALRNLLDNAWKFTRPKGRARIEVGLIPREGAAPVFFVRDDGVGFDMALRGKLFTAFERLHAREAFPGSGIGLATVQRVVQRHGGRVWAEAEPGKGAAFYFTLHEREHR